MQRGEKRGGGRGKGGRRGGYKWMRALIEKSFWSLSENSWTHLRTHFGRNPDQQSSPRSTVNAFAISIGNCLLTFGFIEQWDICGRFRRAKICNTCYKFSSHIENASSIVLVPTVTSFSFFLPHDWHKESGKHECFFNRMSDYHYDTFFTNLQTDTRKTF